jgi:hypothetical protein
LQIRTTHTNGKTAVLIGAGTVAELDKVGFHGMPVSVDQGGR